MKEKKRKEGTREAPKKRKETTELNRVRWFRNTTSNTLEAGARNDTGVSRRARKVKRAAAAVTVLTAVRGVVKN